MMMTVMISLLEWSCRLKSSSSASGRRRVVMIIYHCSRRSPFTRPTLLILTRLQGLRVITVLNPWGPCRNNFPVPGIDGHVGLWMLFSGLTEFEGAGQLPQHFLNFLPLPQGQGSLRLTRLTGIVWMLAAVFFCLRACCQMARMSRHITAISLATAGMA